jgi:hypothetical protein
MLGYFHKSHPSIARKIGDINPILIAQYNGVFPGS